MDLPQARHSEIMAVNKSAGSKVPSFPSFVAPGRIFLAANRVSWGAVHLVYKHSGNTDGPLPATGRLQVGPKADSSPW
jgi:hypothetical protein